MNSFRRYTLGLAIVTVAIFLLIVALAVYLIPLRSDLPSMDLLRMGWYSVNRFGYRSEQLIYSPPLAKAGRYEEYRDIVVLGDSFTNQLPYSWANRIEAHGWSVISASASVDSLLSSPEFQSKPPRVVVYAVVERSLKQSLADGKPCVAPSALAPSTALALPTPKPRTATTSTVTQPERALPDSDQITYARDFLVNSVRLAFRSKQYATQLYALKETRFSNVRSKDLLVLSGDLAKSGWTETDIATMRCRLLEYRAQIEANGRTRFVYLPIPDKLSAYHADLIDPSPPRSVLPELIQPGVESPRLDLALRSAIEEGQIDVYLPSDTHWGTNGYRVAADTVIELLTALSLKAK